MSNEPNVTKAVAESVSHTEKRLETPDKEQEIKTARVSSGVVFKVKEVPQVAYVDLRNSLPEPVPPVWYNEEYDREEPNENDPRYIAQHANWETNMATAIMDLNIMLGSEVESIPSDGGVAPPDSEEFKEKMKILLRTFGWSKQEIREVGKTERYLLWVKYEACSGKMYESDSDLSKLFTAIGRMSGVPEEDVNEAIEKFRD